MKVFPLGVVQHMELDLEFNFVIEMGPPIPTTTILFDVHLSIEIPNSGFNSMKLKITILYYVQTFRIINSERKNHIIITSIS